MNTINKLKIFDANINCLFSGIEIIKITNKIVKEINQKNKKLVFLICNNSFYSIASYLACLNSGNTVLLLNIQTDINLIKKLIDNYKPEFIITIKDEHNYPLFKKIKEDYKKKIDIDASVFILESKVHSYSEIFHDTAVLLSTSGSTGSPKLVRLSYNNIQANADSIVKYLGIDDKEIPITNLPMSYSYGLSIINTHLLVGAKIVCTNDSFMQKSFWEIFKNNNCTSLAGVPYNYSILEKLRFERMNLPSLKTLTQAGGKLAPEKIELFNKIADEKHYKFFVMYGQTEATARISYIPYYNLKNKIGSVGIAIPNGKISIIENNKQMAPLKTAEVVYSGPNVMLGYAETRECLSKHDELNGVLHTGDIGYIDYDGYLFITGRMKRFIKIIGQRINLDEVEKMLEAEFSIQVACLPFDDEIRILIESKKNIDTLINDVKQSISNTYSLHHSLINTKKTKNLLFTSSGKKDYEAMKELF